MVTPWSILVVLAQGNKSNWPEIQVGKILSITLPAGAFSFLGMASDRLGKFLACSLMSPVDPLFNQRSAEAFAARALMLMLTPESDSSHTTHSTRSAIPENLSRRDFFTTFSKELKFFAPFLGYALLPRLVLLKLLNTQLPTKIPIKDFRLTIQIFRVWLRQKPS